MANHPHIFNICHANILKDIKCKVIIRSPPSCVYISFTKVAVTNYHKLDDLQLRHFILTHFWRLEVLNQGAIKVMFSLKAHGGNVSHTFLISSGVSIPPSSASVAYSFSVWMPASVCLLLFLKGHQLYWIRVHHIPIGPYLN